MHRLLPSSRSAFSRRLLACLRPVLLVCVDVLVHFVGTFRSSSLPRFDCDYFYRRRVLGGRSPFPRTLVLSSRCDLTRGLLGSFPPHLFNGSSLTRRLLRHLPSELFFSRCDLTRGLLGSFPPHLFNGSSLTRRLLRHLPSELFFSRCDLTRGLLGSFPPHLFNGSSLTRRLLRHLPSELFFSRCDLTRGLLGSFPPHLFNGSSLTRRLLRHLPSELFFSRCDLTRGLLGSFPPHLFFNCRGLLGQLLDSRRNPPLDLLIRPPTRLFFSLRDLTSGLLGCFPPRLLLSDNNLPDGLVGRLASRPLFSRCDQMRDLLGSFPPHLLFNGRGLLGHLFGQLPSNLLARLLDRHGNPAPNLLIGPPPGPLLRFCDLTRGLLARFPPSPLFSVGNQPRGPLCSLVRHSLRECDRLRDRVFAGVPSCLRRGEGVQRCPRRRRLLRLLASLQLPLALFDCSAPGRFLLGVHVALDQPLPVLGQRLGGLILSPQPRGHSREATYCVWLRATTPQGISQDLRTESRLSACRPLLRRGSQQHDPQLTSAPRRAGHTRAWLSRPLLSGG